MDELNVYAGMFFLGAIVTVIVGTSPWWGWYSWAAMAIGAGLVIFAMRRLLRVPFEEEP